ncbi:hypothetical protein EJ06DRAFT_414764 [Trichodelitschia bisporula]|uniref:Uncharacterized protein n=1 Tax=Trichodelitschia bisporula TaxID=703511 RepID=A0A6G1HYQ7_9PEZI|nr:hypothetical protein EJ06DRAFT_414764 [Trichodelitschia bisporula]
MKWGLRCEFCSGTLSIWSTSSSPAGWSAQELLGSRVRGSAVTAGAGSEASMRAALRPGRLVYANQDQRNYVAKRSPSIVCILRCGCFASLGNRMAAAKSSNSLLLCLQLELVQIQRAQPQRFEVRVCLMAACTEEKKAWIVWWASTRACDILQNASWRKGRLLLQCARINWHLQVNSSPKNRKVNHRSLVALVSKVEASPCLVFLPPVVA